MPYSHAMHYALGVGSNLGDRHGLVTRAEALLIADGTVAMVARSTAQVTVPIGGPRGQEWFLNVVWIVATDLGPHSLLHHMQAIETACGRTRSVRWGPRTLDLDLLARADGLCVVTPVLTLPHPLLAERPFVTMPLAELRAAGAWP